MKKSLFTLLFAVILVYGRSQCVISCSNYAVSAINYSLFPTGSNNVTSSFLPSTDDGATGAIPIGFSFNFYCTTYTNVFICSNGFIQFTPVSWAHGNFVHSTTVIPSPIEPNNMIAFNATDLYPGVGGSVTYTTIGTAPNRQFIVTYSNVPNFSTQSDLNTGQIVLYETTNVIEIHTGIAHGDSNQGGNGSQGIENLYGSAGVPAPGRSNSSSWFPGSFTAYRFQFDYVPLAPAAIMGDTTLCQGLSKSFSISAIPTATAYNWTAPFGWQGSNSTTSSIYTITSSGVVSVSASYSCGTSPATTLSVKTIPSPVISILSATPSIMCSGIPVTFSVGGANTYTLNPGNVTGQIPFVDFPLVSTTYSITGTSTAGCISAGPATVFITVNTTPTVTVNSGEVCSGAQFNFTVSGAKTYQYETGFASVTQTVPGLYNYTVVGTAANGCKSAPATSSLVVHSLPTITAVANRTLICKGETSTLTAGGGTAYVWTHTTSASHTLVVNPIVLNSYSVTGTDVNGCVSGKLVTVSVSACTDLSANDPLVKFLSVYPNPSNDQFTIESRVPVEYVIYDVTGKIVQRGTAEANEKKQISQQLPPGQYLLRAVSPDMQQNLILIKN